MWFTLCQFRLSISFATAQSSHNSEIYNIGVPCAVPSEPRNRDNGASDVWALTAYCVMSEAYHIDCASLLIFFFSFWGTEYIVRCCQMRRIFNSIFFSLSIWRVINQFKATVTHNSHCNHRFVCRSIVLVKQDSLRSVFQAVSEMSLVLLFKVMNYWKETMQLVSGTVVFNSCQVSLLWWHNSFLVSLWTFQPTFFIQVTALLFPCKQISSVESQKGAITIDFIQQ